MLFAYLLHYQRPIAHVRHYAGSTTNLARRFYDHASGNGATLTAEFATHGIPFVVANVWKIPERDAERYIKGLKAGPRLCKVCTPQNRRLLLLETLTLDELRANNIPVTSVQALQRRGV